MSSKRRVYFEHLIEALDLSDKAHKELKLAIELFLSNKRAEAFKHLAVALELYEDAVISIVKTWFERELLRKFIHMFGVLIPFFLLATGDKNATLTLTAILLTIFTIAENHRLSSLGNFRGPGRRLMFMLYRPDEYIGIGAHIFLLLSCLLVVLIFPKEVAIPGLVASFLGDGIASLVGLKVGGFKLPSGKTVIGTLSGSAVVYVTTALFTGPLPALIPAVIYVALESFKLPVSDNLVYPLVISAGCYAVKQLGIA